MITTAKKIVLIVLNAQHRDRGDEQHRINFAEELTHGDSITMNGDWFAWTLLAMYVIATLAYCCDGNWPKVLYFGGSAIITIGILMSH